MKTCIAINLDTGKRCDRPIGRAKSAAAHRLCARHGRSTYLRFLAEYVKTEPVTPEPANSEPERLTEKEWQIIVTIVETLGAAIRAQDWSLARRVWSTLSPLHTMLVERNSLLAHMSTVLIDLDPLVHPHSTAIH